MPLTALIVDDEQNSRDTLRHLLAVLCPDVMVLADAKNTQQARQYITSLKPQLVFLDIQMPGETGIDFLETFTDIDFDMIFITAYEEFAVKAFHLSAIDFLLKPIDPDELVQAVNKVITKQQPPKTEQVKLLKENITNTAKKAIEKLALPTAEGIHFIALKDVVWMESLGAYTKFHLHQQPSVVVSKLIKEYEELLAGYFFIRVHQSSIINLQHVKKYVKGDGGQIWMTDGSEIEVARRRKEELVAALANNFL